MACKVLLALTGAAAEQREVGLALLFVFILEQAPQRAPVLGFLDDLHLYRPNLFMIEGRAGQI